MNELQEIIEQEFLGSSSYDWLIALAIAGAIMVVFFLVKRLLRTRLQRISALTRTPWDDAIIETLGKTTTVALVIFSLAFGSLSLSLSESALKVLGSVVVITLCVQAGLWLSNLLKFWASNTLSQRRAEDPASVASLSVVSWILRVILWTVVVLLVLDNLGFDITALVAGLGIGGVAVALAVQNILSDLFASLSIVLDKPFVVGDFLVVGDFIGVVEQVGLKTTRLRSLSGEQLIMSNADLLQSRLRNYGRMYERRVVFSIGVTYQTPRVLLEKIPGMIESAIRQHEKARFDRSHFKEYGDFSINFETVYYVLGADFALHMDIQQAVNLAIHAAFESNGIEFAYPTQTLFIERGEEPS